MKTIEISILNQSLELVDQSRSRIYKVSTSRFGPGEEKDSHRTPRGKHIIRAKIGAGEPYGMMLTRCSDTSTFTVSQIIISWVHRDP